MLSFASTYLNVPFYVVINGQGTLEKNGLRRKSGGSTRYSAIKWGLRPEHTPSPNPRRLILIVIAVAYALFLCFRCRGSYRTPSRLREIQAQISKTTKEMNQMMKDKVPDAQIMAKQKEIMPLLGESTRSSMKPMFVILPLFLIVYYVLIPNILFGSARLI